MTDAGWRLARFIEGIEDQTTRRIEVDADLVAVGWATVDFDRAVAELSGDLALRPGTFVAAADDVALGARCMIARRALLALDGRRDPAGPRHPIDLILLEPSTEGRLAATLARSDEGPSVAWFAADDVPAAIDAWRRAGTAVATPRDGPFGPASLLLDGPSHGPHRFLVHSAAGTIAP